jgi:hypothetical protein
MNTPLLKQGDIVFTHIIDPNDQLYSYKIGKITRVNEMADWMYWVYFSDLSYGVAFKKDEITLISEFVLNSKLFKLFDI